MLYKDISRWLTLIVGIICLIICIRGLITGEVPARHGTFYRSEDELTFFAGLMFYSVVSIGCFAGFWLFREKKNDLY